MRQAEKLARLTVTAANGDEHPIGHRAGQSGRYNFGGR